MSEKNEPVEIDEARIHYRWRSLAPDPKHFTASDIRDLVDLTRPHLPDKRGLDNIPTAENADKGLRNASVHLVGMLVASNGDDDLIWAWVWIAAAMGERFAGLALAGRLLREAGDISCRDRSRYRRLARAAAFPNYFGYAALEELIDRKSLDDWLSKINVPDADRSMVQAAIDPPRLTKTDRRGRIKLIHSAGGLSAGRRADDRRALDGLEILRTGVTFIHMPTDLEGIRQVLALEFPWAEDVTTAIFDDLFLSAFSQVQRRVGRRLSHAFLRSLWQEQRPRIP